MERFAWDRVFEDLGFFYAELTGASEFRSRERLRALH